MIITDRADDLRPFRPTIGPLKLILAHKLVIAIPILLGIAAGWVIYKATPPQYVAQAVLALDARNIEVIPSTAVVSRLPQENPVLRTELDVISSRVMAETVLARLSDQDKQLFGRLVDQPTPMQQLTGTVRRLLGSGAPQAAPAPIDLAEKLRSSVSVSNDGRSYTIFVTATAGDPRLAALIANTYSEAYLNHQVAIKVAATQRASEWLGQKVEELRAKLENGEAQVGKMRRETGQFRTAGPGLNEQRIAALSAEIARAQAARAEGEAKLATAQQLAKSADHLDAMSEVLASPIIVSLRQQLTALGRTEAELAASGAQDSPQMATLKVSKATLERQIGEEMNRVVTSLQNDVTVAGRRETELQDALQKVVADVGADSKATIQLDQLERETAATRTIYESFLARYRQTIEQEGLAFPEASLITRASEPGSSNSPKLIPFVAVGLFIGAAIGMLFAYAAEALDDRVRSGRALEALAGAPIVAWLPNFRRAFGRTGPQRLYSPYGQSVGKLRTVVSRPGPGRSPQVIALSSAVDGEGKTTLAMSLARSMALAGRKVVVVDADLYNAALSRQMGIGEVGKARDFLEGFGRLDDIVQKDAASEAHVVPAKVFDGSLTTSAGSIGSVVEALRGRYDAVLIDTAPIMASSDAVAVATHADAMLLVVRWRSTKYAVLSAALRELEVCSIKLAGLVVNRSDRTSAIEYPAPHGRRSDLVRLPPRPVEANLLT